MPDAVTYHSDWGKVSRKEKVSSSLDCPWMLVMKYFNTRNVQPWDILEPLTPKTKLSDNWFYMHCVKRYLLCTEVMFWFVMYANESTHRARVRFQGSNSMALFTFQNKYCSSCSRVGTHIVSTVILTNLLCMHTQSNKTKCLKQIYWVNPQLCTPFGTKS